MAEVIFKPRFLANGDWEIAAHCPGGEIEYIAGFKNETETKEWLASERCQAWLKKRGHAK